MIASGILGVFVLKAANDGDAAPKIAREIRAGVLTLSAATRPFIPQARVRDRATAFVAASLFLETSQSGWKTARRKKSNGPPHPANPFVVYHADQPPQVRNM